MPGPVLYVSSLVTHPIHFSYDISPGAMVGIILIHSILLSNFLHHLTNFGLPNDLVIIPAAGGVVGVKVAVGPLKDTVLKGVQFLQVFLNYHNRVAL